MARAAPSSPAPGLKPTRYPPNHLQPAFARWRRNLPATEHVAGEILTLPFYRYLTETDIGHVAPPLMKSARAWGPHHSVRDVLIDVCGESNQSKLALYLRDRDVPDPIGQDQEAFNECAVLISAGTALHIG
ncbi:hypothetical protein ACGFZJ_34270 [Streptomyces sp. NPDC048253]|uniref:hypothetical protein n=1 Tax=Streptomyces sp. NPDC048253 TaxID=3365524 RepID=UPI0037197CA0